MRERWRGGEEERRKNGGHHLESRLAGELWLDIV
jgi:hypothetical protein